MISVPTDLVTITEAYERLRNEYPDLTRDLIESWVYRGKIGKFQRGPRERVFVSLAEVRERATIRPVDDQS